MAKKLSLDEMRAQARQREAEAGDGAEANRAIARTLLGSIPAKGMTIPIQVSSIARSPYQPRVAFDPSELADLAADIRAHGLRQPIEVRRIPGNTYEHRDGHTVQVRGQLYELIDGERRLQTFEHILGWENIDAFVLDVDDRQAAVLVTLANLFRAELCAYEKARAAKVLMDSGGLGTRTAVANAMRVSEMQASRWLAYFELPPQAIETLNKSPNAVGVAFVRDLVTYTQAGYGDLVSEAVKLAAQGKLKNRAVVTYVQHKLQPPPVKPVSTLQAKAGKAIDSRPLGRIDSSGYKVSISLERWADPLKVKAALEQVLSDIEADSLAKDTILARNEKVRAKRNETSS